MPLNNKPSVGKQLRNLFLVLILGIICAIIVSMAAIFYMGPDGSYRVGNILLSPQVAENLSYAEVDPNSGKSARYAFDRIEIHYLEDSGEWKRTEVSLAKYRSFYSEIQGDSSAVVIPEQVRSESYWATPMTLTLGVKKQEGNTDTQTFQEIQFTRFGEYYRILIRAEGDLPNWVYFYHPGIYQLAVKGLL